MNSFSLEALVTVAVRGRFYDATSSIAIKTILDDGLVERRPSTIESFRITTASPTGISATVEHYDDPHAYKLTEKGRVMMNALVSVPQPIVAYTMPGKQ